MSATAFGTVVTAPDGSGLGQVSFADATRLVRFDPQYWAAPWPVPSPGDTVAVCPGTPFWVALARVRDGARTYVFAG